MEYKEYNDNELIYYVRENNEEASRIIFKKYEPLIVSIAKKMYPYCKYNGLEISDLIQEGMLGLNLAILHYEENKDNLFYTFARKCIERKMISFVISSKRQKHKILNESLSLEFSLEEDHLGTLESILSDYKANPEKMLLDSAREAELIHEMRAILTENEERVFELKLAGFHYKEIASIIDKTPKSVDNTIQRIRAKCKDLLEKK